MCEYYKLLLRQYMSSARLISALSLVSATLWISMFMNVSFASMHVSLQNSERRMELQRCTNGKKGDPWR
jgi:hypothetical protein